MKFQKIGVVNFLDFKTQFKITDKVRKYLEDEGISLACLLPDAWSFYEASLFEGLDEDEDGIPDEKFGKKFIAIYNKITESLGWSEEKGLETSGFEDKIDSDKIILRGGIKLSSVKNPNKEFVANYVVLKD